MFENWDDKMLFEKMALFKHNKADAPLGWLHTIGEQCTIVK